jgi:predicted nucleic acid-binding protein
MVVFDATQLSLLFRPGSPAPLDPSTGARVEHADLRVAALVERLEKARTVIVIPTPVLSEVLIKAANSGPAILAAFQKSSVFRLVGFDARAAVELAQITNEYGSGADKRAGIEAPWSKIKFDRQVVAIARVIRATAIYTDDDKLIAFASLNDIPCIRVADLPIPDSARQAQLPFEAGGPSETPDDKPETA